MAQHSHLPHKLQRGLSLIELVVVMAIIAILSSIAYPLYNGYIVTGKRSEGKTLLINAAAREERYYSDNNEYTATVSNLGISSTSENGHYTLSVSGLSTNNQTFVLTATPTFSDTVCGNLSLSNAGVRTSNDNATCWGR